MILRNSLLASAASLAFAAQAASAAPGTLVDRTKTASEIPEVAELIVGAEKREEKLQATPLSVTVINAEQRSDLQITTMQDLSNYVPGLVYYPDLDRVYIRGIGATTDYLGVDQGVAVYNDGFYSPSAAWEAVPPLFTSKEEVLRGPQGTLYGNTAIGGSIDITSLRPSKTYTAEVNASFENYEHDTVAATLSGPFNDWLQARLDVSNNRQRQGYFTNVAGGPSEGNARDDWYVEAQLAAQPGPFELNLRVDSASWNDRPRTNSDPEPYCTATPSYFGGQNACGQFGPQPAIASTVGYAIKNPATTNPFLFNTNTPSHETLKADYDLIANITFHGGVFDVKYTGGLHGDHYDQIEDVDDTARGAWLYTPPPIPDPAQTPQPSVLLHPRVSDVYGLAQRYSSHELIVESTGASRLQWLAGYYMFNEDFSLLDWTSSPGQTQLRQPAYFVAAPLYDRPVAGPTGALVPAANPNEYINSSLQRLFTASNAIYGQATYDLASTLKLTGGLRYTVDHKLGQEDVRWVAFAPGQYNFPAINGSYHAIDETQPAVCPSASQVTYSCKVLPDRTGRQMSASWPAWTGTAKLSWQPSAQTLAYLSYSRGEKAGGFILGQVFVPGETFAAQEEVSPETLDDYELGLKETINRNLTIDSVLYYYDYQNEQLQNYETDPLSGVNEVVSVNLPHVWQPGLEIEAAWATTPELGFSLAYAYEHARISGLRCENVYATGSLTAPTDECVYDTLNHSFKSIDGAIAQAAPASKISLTADYTLRFTPGILTLSATYDWRDGNYSSFFNDAQYYNPAYGLVDLRAIWKMANGRYSVNAYVNNLFGRVVVESRSPEFLLSQLFVVPTYVTPRVFGVEVRYRFQ